jgi:hypothetical protein
MSSVCHTNLLPHDSLELRLSLLLAVCLCCRFKNFNFTAMFIPDGTTVNETANKRFQVAARQAFMIGVHTQSPMFIKDSSTGGLQIARVIITHIVKGSQIGGSAPPDSVVVSYEFSTPASAVAEDVLQLNRAVVNNTVAFAATAAVAALGNNLPEVEGALLTKVEKAVALSPQMVFGLAFGLSCAGGLAAGFCLGWIIVQQSSRKRQRRSKALHRVVRGNAVLAVER